jgi:hypothetical protein
MKTDRRKEVSKRSWQRRIEHVLPREKFTTQEAQTKGKSATRNALSAQDEAGALTYEQAC